MPRNGLVGSLTFAFLLTLAGAADAFVVTIEPDDYAPGTDLSNVSDYVTLRARYTTAIETTDEPITADNRTANAPTGKLTFGNHAFWPYGDGEDLSYSGFHLIFHQAISHLTLLADNSSYPGLPADWIALDRDGNRLGFGRAGGGVPGESFLVDIRVDNLWSIVIGGNDAIGAIWFDHLTFDVADIPEPSPWLLLAPGLALLALRQRWSAKTNAAPTDGQPSL